MGWARSIAPTTPGSAGDAAIKVLPESLDADPERGARFEREARVLAAPSQPHIGAIYGVEETAGPKHTRIGALVLERVNGPTLSDRLPGGPLLWRNAADCPRRSRTPSKPRMRGASSTGI